ncbi:Clp protease N-terminal domain-containing protein [Streptomyces sp. NBC_00448]|uniref:Clp protease N-terminal domain-containing protein n=1 Tax=Streptomyces sp. NBC_00448 TaxID=2903652 RepID=UPI002E21A853
MSMSFGPGFGSSDPFSDLLNRFFGMSPGSSPPAVQRVPIGRLPSESARELINSAARRAEEDDAADLDTEHLLRAATKVDPARSLVAQAGTDPDTLARKIAEALPRGTGEPAAEPGLTPAAKRILSAAYAHAQAAGVSCIGPEHILGALLDDADSDAVRLLRSLAFDVDRLRTASDRAAGSAQPPAGGGKPATTLDEYGRDLTHEAKAGKLDPVVGRAEEIEQTVEILSRRSKNNPVLISEPDVGTTALVAHGHQSEFGARPLRRTIQAELDNRIASLLLGGEADPGDTIVADVEDNSLHCTVRPKPADAGDGTADDNAS